MDKKNSGKAPSYQMYPKDWNEDHDLKMCSFAAEGLWIRLVNTSFEMPVKGVFSRRLNGGLDGVETKLKPSLTPLKLEEIANLIRGNTREKMRLLQELIANNVLKRLADGECAGAFYVKRIYEDMKLRAIRAEAGKQGGNPNLTGHLVENLLNQNPEQTPKQIPTPSSSSSTSTSVNTTNTTTMRAGTNDLSRAVSAGKSPCQALRDLVEFWNGFARQKANAEDIGVEYAYTQAVARWGIEAIMGAIENYRQALLLPHSQAWDRPLGRLFLDIEKFIPGIFNLNNFDKTQFKTDRNETHKRDHQSTELGFR